MNKEKSADNLHDEKLPVRAGKETTTLSIVDKVAALIGKAQVSDTVYDDLDEIRRDITPHTGRE